MLGITKDNGQKTHQGFLAIFFLVFFQCAQNLLHFLMMGNFSIVTQQVSKLLLIFVVCDSFVDVFSI